MRGSNGPLLAGIGVLALAVAALAYLFGVSPRLDAAETAREQAEFQSAENDRLEIQLAQLISDFERLPEIREAIYDVRDDLPPTQDVAGFRRDVAAIFEASDLIVLEESIGTPQLVRPNLNLQAQFREVGIRNPTADSSFARLVATPVTLGFVGSVADAFQVTRDLQFGDHRFFLVTAMRITGIAERGEERGVEVQPGDVSIELTGVVLTLDYGVADIQVRPVVEVIECIERPEDAEEGDGIESPEAESPETDTADPEADIPLDENGEPLPFCADESRPDNFNPFEPLN